MNREFIAPGPGPWELDSTHFPHPMSTFAQGTELAGFIRGFTETLARYGSLLDHLHPAFCNGWLYMQARPYGAPPGAMKPPPKQVLWLLMRVHPKMRKRIAIGKRAIDTKLWRRDLELWDNVDKPAAIAKHRAIQSVTVAVLDDAELVEHLRVVQTHFDDMSALHHKYTATTIVPTGDYLAFGLQWTSASAGQLLELVGGSSPISLGFAAHELEAAGAAIRSSQSAMQLLGSDSLTATEVLTRLQTDDPARAAVRAYVEAVQYRSLGYDVSEPTAGELPEQLLATLKQAASGSIQARKPADPETIRSQVPAEQQPEFDNRLAELRHVNRIRDERGQYSDGWASGLARRAVLEAGSRLQHRGLINSAQHAPDLSLPELRTLLLDGTGPSTTEIEERYRYRTTARVEDAPPFLNGEPPPPPPVELLPKAAQRMMIATNTMLGNLFASSDKVNSETVIRGLPVSPGTYIGPARVVNSVEDFAKIQQGDILVTRSTSPYFNVILPLLGAIVTDRGGQLCHAAIVAREFGIPGVVGTREATTKITDGMTLEVDSVAGEVRIKADSPLVHS